MNTINRISGPVINSIENPPFPQYEQEELSNGLSVYMLSGGTQDIFKVDLIFDAGRKFEAKRGAARLCSFLMKEGISGYKAHDLAEFWDFHGAIVKSFSDLDFAGHSMLGMNRYIDDLMPNWIEIFNNPIMDEKELRIHSKLMSEKLALELSKNDILSYRMFTEYLYGKDHYYGYNTTPEDYLAVQRNDVLEHYQTHYGVENAYAVVSGKINSKAKSKLLGHLNSIDLHNEAKPEAIPFDIKQSNAPIKKFLATDKELQVSLKMGAITIHSHHPDYAGLSTLVHILGGFFGSRLMSKLREEKGLCYNIYASLDRMVESSYLYISADLNKDNLRLAYDEIISEIKILQKELIPDEELKMVKNYIKGNMLAALDGPIRSGEILKSYLSHKLPFDYFRQFLDKLESISAKELRELANNYLIVDEMTIVTVGATNF